MKHILCFGDSNTWGYDCDALASSSVACTRMPFDVRWPGVAQNLLGSEYRIIEDGLPGRTNIMEDALPHRQGLASLEVALEVHTPLDLVIIHTGINELKPAFDVGAGMIAVGVEKLVIAAQHQQACYGCPPPKVLLIAPPPVKEHIADMRDCIFGPLAYGKSLELGKAYKDVAERCGCGFIDCAELNFELNDLDGLHYCRKDHAKLGSAVAEKAREMLG